MTVGRIDPRPLVEAAGRFAAGLWLTVDPHGGQATARRNAWVAMSASAARARLQAEAERALAVRALPSAEVANR